MYTTKKLIIVLGLCFNTGVLFCQDDLLSLIDEQKDEGPKKVYATFKSYRVGSAQSIETVKKKHLDYRITHRFGNLYNADLKNPLNETFQTFFGMDGASDIRNSLDYGLTENITVGIGRSRNKLVDGSVKWKFLHQTTNFAMPVSVALFSSAGYSHARAADVYSGIEKNFKTDERHRLNYFTQLIIASKLTSWLSLELLPGFMYRNYIKERINTQNNEVDVNGFVTLGIAGRAKLTKRVSIIADYFYNTPKFYQKNSDARNPLSVGIELETGGHVFSLFFTNASYIVENNYIPLTSDTWTKGQVKFGFCISRTFTL